MRTAHRVFPSRLIALGVVWAGTALAGPVPADAPLPGGRVELLDTALDATANIASVRAQTVTLAPKQSAPLHRHPCHVVGVVREGAIDFQLEGGPVRRLGPGDAFHEPAGTRVLHFDNAADVPARFTVFYLLGEGQTRTTELLHQVAAGPGGS